MFDTFREESLKISLQPRFPFHQLSRNIMVQNGLRWSRMEPTQIAAIGFDRDVRSRLRCTTLAYLCPLRDRQSFPVHEN